MNALTGKYLWLAYAADNRPFKEYTKQLSDEDKRIIVKDLKDNDLWDTVPHSPLISKDDER